VRGINFQPAFYSGRHIAHDPMQRLTIPDILKALEEQTEGLLQVSDFVPVPCCFPTCNSVTYVLIDGDTVLPLPRVLNVEDYLDYVTNRAVPDLSEDIKAALEGLWSSSAVPGSTKSAQQFALSCAACNVSDGLDMAAFAQNIFMIMLQDFMDPWTFNQKNVMKCCKEILLPDGKQIPFCAYNSVGYREQAREQLQARERKRNQARRMGVPYTPEQLTFSFEHVPDNKPITPGVRGAVNGHEA
jgi:uncharacterized radical SAM superfamily Fe-S cluster-containing enzyme